MLPSAPTPNTFVDTFARGLAVIESFGAGHAERSLAEVAASANISRAAARRLLLTLCHLGYAQQQGRTFRLTPKAMRLGYAYLSGQSVAEIVQPYVVSAAERTGESSSVCVLDDTDVVYIARASSRRIISLNLAVGTRLPAWATAHGRILLGALDDRELDARLARSDIQPLTRYSLTDHDALRQAIRQTRVDGYSFVRQELELGLTAVAMPLCDRSGQVVAAINLAGHSERNSDAQMLDVFLPLLRATVADINAALAAR